MSSSADINEQIRTMKESHKLAHAKAIEAKHNQDNSASVKERAQKAAEANWQLAQEELQKAEDAFKDIESRHESLSLEVEGYREQTNALVASIEAAKDLDAQMAALLQDQKAELAQHNGATDELKARLAEHKRALQKLESTIARARENITDCVKARDQAALRLSEIVHRIASHRKDSEDAEIKVCRLVEPRFYR